MTAPKAAAKSHSKVVYKGTGISVRSLEETIHTERGLQNDKVKELNQMGERNLELQRALTEEMDKLRDLSEAMQKSRSQQGVLRGFLSRLGLTKDAVLSRRSIEQLLRRQYELSALRLKEAAELADRLEVAKVELYDEIERLGAKVLASAEDEETAARLVLGLRDELGELEVKLHQCDGTTALARKLQLERDQIKRQIAEHSTRLKISSTAEDRLARLVDNTRNLAETIASLQADVTRYVTAAGEKMDLIAGQIQAIGAAADASMVMLELKESLDALTDSVNHTTRFVVETQAYFRENVDRMIGDLELYDEETEQVLSAGINWNEAYDELDVEAALSKAIARRVAEHDQNEA